jgi:chaperonin cofactor prefoldin
MSSSPSLPQLQALNDEMQKHGKDLRGVQNSLSVCQRETRSNQVTSNQINALNESTPLYRACGKGFYMSTQEEVKSDLQREEELLARTAKDLASREEFLERRIAQNRSNMIDIAS